MVSAMQTTGATHDPFDPEFARGVVEGPYRPLKDHWFRPRLIGRNRLPAAGPSIVVPNHSGMAFPYDGLVLDALLWEHDGFRPEAKYRSLFEKRLALRWWMRPFGIDDFWRRCAGVDITFDNFDRLLARGDRLIYYPEGVRGIGKGFQNRYCLQPFHTSFVTLALQHRVPVTPVYVINAEWMIPLTFTLRPVDWLMQRLFRVPFLPLPAAPLAMLLPWAWWMALPCRMIFVVGESIDLQEIARDFALPDPSRPDRAAAARIAERVRTIMQRQLTRLAGEYGNHPYQRRSLVRSLRKARQHSQLAASLPTGWPTRFHRFDRDRQRPPASGWTLRDWDLAAYYLPFGWPLLSLTRAFRRPPYGYRGLSRDERLARKGDFIWKLAERPLPPRTECR